VLSGGLGGAGPVTFATLPLTAGRRQAELVVGLLLFVVLVSVSMQGLALPSVTTVLKMETNSPLGARRPGTTARRHRGRLHRGPRHEP
jgi:NhaP-type Na+/H+ and K+/H+ antiporter